MPQSTWDLNLKHMTMHLLPLLMLGFAALCSADLSSILNVDQASCFPTDEAKHAPLDLYYEQLGEGSVAASRRSKG